MEQRFLKPFVTSLIAVSNEKYQPALFQASHEFESFIIQPQSYQASMFAPKGLAPKYSPMMRAKCRCKTADCAGSIVHLKYITEEVDCPGHLL
jgi:hypothetical protein